MSAKARWRARRAAWAILLLVTLALAGCAGV